MATGRVEIADQATVTGRVLAPKFLLADGGQFNGRVEPQHLEAALKVWKHRRTDTEADAPAPVKQPA